MHCHYSFTEEDNKEQNLTSDQRVLEEVGRFMQVSRKLEIILKCAIPVVCIKKLTVGSIFIGR